MKMFNLTITADTAEGLRLKLLDMVNQMKAVTVNKAEQKPVISQEEMAENVANAPDYKLPEPPPIEDVRAALKNLRERKGADAVRELLKAYGAENLTKLKPEDYAGALSRALSEV